MKGQRFSEEQIIAVLKESGAGAKTKDFAVGHGISEPTFHNWKAKYACVTVSEAHRLRQNTSVEFGDCIAAETAKWGGVVKQANVKTE